MDGRKTLIESGADRGRQHQRQKVRGRATVQERTLHQMPSGAIAARRASAARRRPARPLAIERVEARADDDGRADRHRRIGNVAEDEEAEQERPKQRGVAEGRDGGDVADAHGDDDELVADHQKRRGSGGLQPCGGVRRAPAAHRDDQREPGHRDRSGGQGGDQQGGHVRRQAARREVAHGAEADADQHQQRIGAERLRAGLDDDQDAEEADADGQPAPPADGLAERPALRPW